MSKIGSFGAKRQEMSQIMPVKELQAMISLIRDNDSLILGVKGDSIRIIEFSICRALLSSAKSQLLIQWSFEWLLIELIGIGLNYVKEMKSNKISIMKFFISIISSHLISSHSFIIFFFFLALVFLMYVMMLLLTCPNHTEFLLQ